MLVAYRVIICGFVVLIGATLSFNRLHDENKKSYIHLARKRSAILFQWMIQDEIYLYMLICVRIKQVKYKLGNDFDFNQAERYLTSIMKFQHMRLLYVLHAARRRKKIVPGTEKILEARKDSSKYIFN